MCAATAEEAEFALESQASAVCEHYYAWGERSAFPICSLQLPSRDRCELNPHDYGI
jgi:hypothetical protein